jgi:Bcr/CflA subfamily drug resistance transporter
MEGARHKYETFVVFLAALINSLGGAAIDLYAPSMPAIGAEFGVSASVMQSTITATLAGYAVGQLFFGVMSDSAGRRPSIVLGASLFIAASITAMVATNVEALVFARAVQGFAIGSCQVVARAILVDNISGPRFYVAITYLSLAFGLGPVIAPFVGGYVQELAGWRYNFSVYVLYGVIVFSFSFFGLKESLSPTHRKSPLASLMGYRVILGNTTFMSAVVVLGSSFSSFLIWNVIGPFVMQDRLGYSPAIFGESALGVGVSYLFGTILNRLLVKRVPTEGLMAAGAGLYVFGMFVMAFDSRRLDLTSALAGVMIIAFAQGLIFSNAMGRSMSLFPDRAGAAASLQGCLMILCGTIVSALASRMVIESNADLFAIFLVLFLAQAVGLFALLRTTVPHSVARDRV